MFACKGEESREQFGALAETVLADETWLKTLPISTWIRVAFCWRGTPVHEETGPVVIG